MRIAISGSHSLGKSTFVKDFAQSHPDFQYEQEPYRALCQDHNILFAEAQTCDHIQLQLDYSIEKLHQYSPGDKVIFDRCPADFIPYASYSIPYGTADIDQTFVNSLYPKVKEALKDLDLIVFIPISSEHPILLEDDGIRPTHDFYREWVDSAFKVLYRKNLKTIFPDQNPPKLIEIVGPRQARLNALNKIIQKLSVP
jgi:nicotinamide riboside kinase